MIFKMKFYNTNFIGIHCSGIQLLLVLIEFVPSKIFGFSFCQKNIKLSYCYLNHLLQSVIVQNAKLLILSYKFKLWYLPRDIQLSLSQVLVYPTANPTIPWDHRTFHRMSQITIINLATYIFFSSSVYTAVYCSIFCYSNLVSCSP